MEIRTSDFHFITRSSNRLNYLLGTSPVSAFRIAKLSKFFLWLKFLDNTTLLNMKKLKRLEMKNILTRRN
jgi:hypothetical protein